MAPRHRNSRLRKTVAPEMAGPASSGPSTSQDPSRPANTALKPRAMTPDTIQRMAMEAKILRLDELNDVFEHEANVALDKLDDIMDEVLRPEIDPETGLPLVDDDEALDEMARQFETLQASAFALQSLHGPQAHFTFKTIEKHKPPEIIVKKQKQSKKEKKLLALAAKAAERNHKEKTTPSVTAAPKTPQRVSVDENNEVPVAINKGKRRAAAAVAVAAVSASSAAEKSEKTEKRPRKESSAKKRTSTRLSKTPRANTKEEEEPTYCFCSRVSFGDMIGCDNDKCEIEWYHFECIGLTTKPKGKWFCPNCRHPDSARMPKTAKNVKKDKE